MSKSQRRLIVFLAIVGMLFALSVWLGARNHREKDPPNKENYQTPCWTKVLGDLTNALRPPKLKPEELSPPERRMIIGPFLKRQVAVRAAPGIQFRSAEFRLEGLGFITYQAKDPKYEELKKRQEWPLSAHQNKSRVSFTILEGGGTFTFENKGQIACTVELQ